MGIYSYVVFVHFQILTSVRVIDLTPVPRCVPTQWVASRALAGMVS